MSTEAQGRTPRMVLTEQIIQQGELAYDPEVPIQDRASAEVAFEKLLAITKTMALIPVLTSLVQPGRVKTWLRPHVIKALSLLPLRPNGVRNTIEFIFSVHPSNSQNVGTKQAAAPESRGPSISLEALNSASRLVSSPPSSVPAETWFFGIAPQLLSLLDGEGGLEMIKASSYIIGYGILGRRQLGAPGTAGWLAFAEPLISQIDPTLRSVHISNDKQSDPEDAEVVTLNNNQIIVTAAKLSEGLRRLASLISSHPNPGLSKRLLDRLLLPLWALSSWAVDNPEDLEEWRAPAGYLLQILLQLSSSSALLLTIIDNLLFQGNQDSTRILWTYKPAPNDGIQIERPIHRDEQPLANLDAKVNAFIELLRPWKENDEVPELFLVLCKRWLSISDSSAQKPQVIYTLPSGEDDSQPELRLVEIKILQRMMDELPERLVGNSNQVLELANDVLQRVAKSKTNPDNDDTTAIALSLLNVVFTSPNSKTIIEHNQDICSSVKASLDTLAKIYGSENATTAQNLLFLMEFQANDTEDKPLPVTDKASEERRTYNLALSYLTSTDSPPPVRAQGVDLLTSLIDANSSILDIPATLVLLSSLLQDEEEYIYLRIIKAFVLLSTKHPRAVTRDLLDRYLDPNEERSLDTRLRLGESLLQVVEHCGSSFSGDLAHHVSGGLLAIAGRRGYRPKTEAQQKRKAALDKSKNKEAEDAWDGPVPQLEETTIDDEILNQIVEGWESKRGQEDVRIRASALSIFGAAIETNIAGMVSTKISEAVDLSINILALESEHEKAILRRSAILLIMSLVRALDKAREDGTKLGFGFAGQSLEDVMRILRYVQETDNDGLVKQHAEDVIEGLNTWQVKSLLASRDTVQTSLDGLAGLSVNPLVDREGRVRPRIEEIE